ncbi:MAG: DUF1073 domain-containing protein [Rhodobacteraceae bacterium]|nr:DUF1073 domain-containing protein [Paracoccaceae bacterium]
MTLRPNLFTRVQNATVRGRSGAGGPQDRGVHQTFRGASFHPLNNGGPQQDREWLSLYEKEWTATKIIDIPVEDMLREGWRYTGISDEANKTLEAFEKDFDINELLRECLALERLFGGCVAFLGFEDDNQDPASPIDEDNPGKLRFINISPRNDVTAGQFSNNVTSPRYGKTETYTISGTVVHRSRLLIFDGKPISRSRTNRVYLPGHRRDGFGNSVLAPIFDDLARATGSRQGAYHLLNQASVWILRTKMRSLQGTQGGEAALAELQGVADQISMYNAAIIDSDPKNGDIQQISASFSSVPELMLMFLQVLSAASDIPATRFLGQAPGGLNATGESDLENYYNSIASKQKQQIKPHLMRLSRYALGGDSGGLDIEFEPLWNSSDEELAIIRTADVNNVLLMVQQGLMSQEEAVKELVLRDAIETPIDLTQVRGGGEPDQPLDVAEQLQKLRELQPNGASDQRTTVQEPGTPEERGSDPKPEGAGGAVPRVPVTPNPDNEGTDVALRPGGAGGKKRVGRRTKR